jgi:hypothetical protein
MSDAKSASTYEVGPFLYMKALGSTIPALDGLEITALCRAA